MATERIIDVKKQNKLSLKKCFQLVCSGIMHRLLRSTLTMSVILLAVAFFMSMLSESMYIKATAEGVDERMTEKREAAAVLSFLYNKPNTVILSKRLSEVVDEPAKIKEYANFANWDLDRMMQLTEKAQLEQDYLYFFENLDVGKRLILVKKNTEREIFEYLSAASANLQNFEADLEPLKTLKLPHETENEGQFRQFIKDYPDYISSLNQLVEDWSKTLDSFAEKSETLTAGKKIEEWLCTSDSSELSQWVQYVNDTGFNLTAERLERIVKYLKKVQVRRDVAAMLNTPENKGEWKKLFQERHALDQKLLLLSDPRAMKVLDNRFTKEQLLDVQQMYAEELKLMEIEKKVMGKTEKKTGGVLSGRQFFLLIISFVVCMVGIANAMLMAITERFREIATMKCLGATDGYILTQFMMEAALQGLAGGLLGMLIGFLLSLLKGSFQFGSFMFSYFPGWGILVCGCISISIGVVLAALASMYPSWQASRMAPMEAMRVE